MKMQKFAAKLLVTHFEIFPQHCISQLAKSVESPDWTILFLPVLSMPQSKTVMCAQQATSIKVSLYSESRLI